ncbi:hypothetical protein BV25DRAFT_705664 [Artomyces pyxidatus]|uniref:Uncharacterized protein n=1 Tax=Artomyces pyxidatus TaxID=48021 RepID=A0ACB8T054_9AGAM|nr:hypothetical protein BV25DRAFT_705664 [Artomyces pyxidatus]
MNPMHSRWKARLENMILAGSFTRDDAAKAMEGYMKITKIDAAAVPCANCSKHDQTAHHGNARTSLCDACASGALRRCSRCQGVSYCSKECQKAHWTKHKMTCAKIVDVRTQKLTELGELENCDRGFRRWCDEQLAHELYHAVKELVGHPSVTRAMPCSLQKSTITRQPDPCLNSSSSASDVSISS